MEFLPLSCLTLLKLLIPHSPSQSCLSISALVLVLSCLAGQAGTFTEKDAVGNGVPSHPVNLVI